MRNHMLNHTTQSQDITLLLCLQSFLIKVDEFLLSGF